MLFFQQKYLFKSFLSAKIWFKNVYLYVCSRCYVDARLAQNQLKQFCSKSVFQARNFTNQPFILAKYQNYCQKLCLFLVN